MKDPAVGGLPRQELLSALDSPLPLVVVEAVPGGGKRTLLAHWAQDQTAEYRVVVRATEQTAGGAQLLRLIWATFQAQARLNLPRLSSHDDEVLADIQHHLGWLARPVAIALTGADHFDRDSCELLLHLLETESRLRLIVAGFDTSALTTAASLRRIPFASLDDHDLEFTRDETQALLEASGLPAGGEASQVLHRVTRGHPGMTAAAIEAFPAETGLGTITSEQALGAFLDSTPLQAWPSSLARMVTVLVDVPRFTAREAELITRDAAAAHLHRLQRLGLGQMVYDAVIGQRVFSWHEPVRVRISQFLRQLGEPRPPGLRERIVEAALLSGDRELQVGALVAGGEFAAAERVLRDCLWDVLPDSWSPIWSPLQDVSPLALADFPGLLCVRQRVGRGTSGSLPPQTTRSIVRQILAHSSRDPWERLATCARAFELARQGQAFDTIRDLAARVQQLATELLRDGVVTEVGPGAVSDLLLIAQAALQLGSTGYAADFAGYAVQLIERNASRLDPAEARWLFASRVLLFSYRERGLGDPMSSDIALAGPQRHCREADIVAAHLARAWGELDAGNLAVADAHCRVAVERVGRTTDWPVLVIAQALVLALQGKAEELRVLVTKYEHDIGPRQDGSLGSGGRTRELANRLIQRLIGRALPIPEFLSADGVGLTPDQFGFAPRVDHAGVLAEAVDALRAGRTAVARSFLERAIGLLPARGLAPIMLALATPDEIHRLAGVIEDHPGAAGLRLEQALGYATVLGSPVEELSERELEVLAFLRQGAPNRVIAEAMFLSVNTVKFHRANLMRKLGARNRDEALEKAARRGL